MSACYHAAHWAYGPSVCPACNPGSSTYFPSLEAFEEGEHVILWLEHSGLPEKPTTERRMIAQWPEGRGSCVVTGWDSSPAHIYLGKLP